MAGLCVVRANNFTSWGIQTNNNDSLTNGGQMKENPQIVLKKILQGTGVLISLLSGFGLCMAYIEYNNHDNDWALLLLPIMLIVGVITLYTVYVAYLLIQDFSPRAVRHLSSEIAVILIAVVSISTKDVVVLAPGIIIAWLLHKVLARYLHNIFWDSIKEK